MLAVKAQTSLAFARLLAALTALRALEVAYARCKSSNQFGFCSLTRSFHLSVYFKEFHLLPALDNHFAIFTCDFFFNLVLGKQQRYHLFDVE